MYNVVFIVSHLGAGSNFLFDAMNKNPRIQGYHLGALYDHPESLHYLVGQPHKLSDSSAIYMDELLFNYSFSCKRLYNCCKFIYVIREARESLNEILQVSQIQYTESAAFRYYCYRLRRMCEMAKRTPGAVVLTWEDLASKKGLNLIEQYLGLKKPISLPDIKTQAPNIFDSELVRKAQESYERHLFFLRHLNLATNLVPLRS